MKKYSQVELQNILMRQLDLSGNQIIDAGSIALSKNTTLRQLDLEYNQTENIFMDKQLIKNS
jgi:Leucine-rich repeat (LRR) protein